MQALQGTWYRRLLTPRAGQFFARFTKTVTAGQQDQLMGESVRIFVAYGYNSRDKWIEDSIQPIVEAFGSEFVHGGDLGGQQITEGVRALINSSDSLLAFATRRDAVGNDQFATHRWVTDELAYAIGQGKQVLEIREDGVLEQGGIAGDRQRITFRADDRLRCLVEVIKTLGRWHRRDTRRFQLIPDDLVRPHLSKPYFRCRYTVLEGTNESLPRECRPENSGRFVHRRIGSVAEFVVTS